MPIYTFFGKDYCMKLLQHPETTQPQKAEIITIGKVNFIVNEHFPDNGKEIRELMELLVVKKCREVS